MTALSSDRKCDKMDVDGNVIPLVVNYPVKAATKIYGGSMVALDTSGRAVPASAVGTLKVIGKASKQVDNTAGTDGALRIDIELGVFYFNSGTGADLIAAANVQSLCYAIDDNTVGLTDAGGTRPAAGVVFDVRASDGAVGVYLGAPSLYIANPETAPSASTAFKARAVQTAALAAYTRTAGVITETANGALGAADGVTLAVGDVIFLPEGIAAAAADAGPWQVTALGSAGAKFVLTRPDWYTDGGAIVPGTVIEVGGEGTLFASSSWKSFAAAGQLIDTGAPLFWPREVLQQVVLVAGTATISNVPIKSATKTNVGIQRTVANTSTATTGGYCPTNAGANGITAGTLGTGSVIIQACVAAGTINNADVSTLNVCITNW